MNTRNPTQPDDLDERIANADARGCYAPAIPIQETICAPGYSHSLGGYPYVFLSDIPEQLHDYLNRKAIGSSCPTFREDHTAYWLYDMNRWLGAIGVKLDVQVQTHNPASFSLPDPDAH